MGTIVHRGVLVDELLARDGCATRGADLLVARPYIFQVDVLAVLVLSDGVVLQIDLDRACERVGHDERRARQVVAACVRRDAALEVTVPGEHAGDVELVVHDRLLDGLGQRARVADAGRAAVAHGVEADGVQVLGEPCAIEVLGDDARTGRQRGLDPGLGGDAQVIGLLGDQARGDHHVGVARCWCSW